MSDESTTTPPKPKRDWDIARKRFIEHQIAGPCDCRECNEYRRAMGQRRI